MNMSLSDWYKGHSSTREAEFASADNFAACLKIYLGSSKVVQKVIRDMVAIVNDTKASNEERNSALATLVEALFSSEDKNI